MDVLSTEVLELLAFGDSEPAVTPEEFFDPAFMREHTEFADFAAFRSAGPWELGDDEDIEDVPEAALDGHVAATTGFESWLAMRNAAAERAVVDRLGW